MEHHTLPFSFSNLWPNLSIEISVNWVILKGSGFKIPQTIRLCGRFPQGVNGQVYLNVTTDLCVARVHSLYLAAGEMHVLIVLLCTPRFSTYTLKQCILMLSKKLWYMVVNLIPRGKKCGHEHLHIYVPTSIHKCTCAHTHICRAIIPA